MTLAILPSITVLENHLSMMFAENFILEIFRDGCCLIINVPFVLLLSCSAATLIV